MFTYGRPELSHIATDHQSIINSEIFITLWDYRNGTGHKDSNKAMINRIGNMRETFKQETEKNMPAFATVLASLISTHTATKLI